VQSQAARIPVGVGTRSGMTGPGGAGPGTRCFFDFARRSCSLLALVTTPQRAQRPRCRRPQHVRDLGHAKRAASAAA
jgi:hypothetical protein